MILIFSLAGMAIGFILGYISCLNTTHVKTTNIREVVDPYKPLEELPEGTIIETPIGEISFKKPRKEVAFQRLFDLVHNFKYLPSFKLPLDRADVGYYKIDTALGTRFIEGKLTTNVNVCKFGYFKDFSGGFFSNCLFSLRLDTSSKSFELIVPTNSKNLTEKQIFLALKEVEDIINKLIKAEQDKKKEQEDMQLKLMRRLAGE